MATTYIITIEDFKDKVKISQNLDSSKLKVAIGITQDIYAVKVLCSDYYAEVLAGLGAPSAALTAVLPYIKDYLIYKSYARYLVSAGLLMTPAGARVQIDTTSTPASDKQVGEVISQAENDANFYQDQLVNFLTKNEDTYTTWRDSICGCGRRTKLKNKFSVAGVQSHDTEVKWT